MFNNVATKARDTLDNTYIALQAWHTNPANIPVPDVVNTKRPQLTREQMVARYLTSVEGNPNIDINKPTTAARAPRMLGKARPEQEQGLTQQLWRYFSDRPSTETAASQGTKRSAVSEQEDSKWRPMFSSLWLEVNLDPESIGTLFNELSLMSCKPSKSGPPGAQACSSSPGIVYLDYIGPRPHKLDQAFSYPILVERDLRTFKSESFNALRHRLQAAAVDVITIGSECGQIAPGHPGLCKSLAAGDQITQIDKFFSENRVQGKSPGVVFVDGDVINAWGEKHSQSGTTALSIRPNKSGLWISIGIGIPALGLIASIVGFYWKRWLGCPASDCQQKSESATAEIEEELAANSAQDHESSLVIDSSDSDTPLGYSGDFSSSSSTSETAPTCSATVNGAEGRLVIQRDLDEAESKSSR